MNNWTEDKPEFTEECVLLTAVKTSGGWDYSSWLIMAVTGYDDNNNPAWYYALCEMDGEEFGPLEDLSADKYLVIPLLK